MSVGENCGIFKQINNTLCNWLIQTTYNILLRTSG